MSRIVRYCIVCEMAFIPVRRDNIYCSGACKQKAWRMSGGAAKKGIKQSREGDSVAGYTKPFMERRK